MATITSVASGNWGTAGTWDSGVPVNGDDVVIAEGHSVTFNVDQSGFANGLTGLTINGMLIWSGTSSTTLKMNGNITGTGKLIVGHKKPITSGLSLLDGYEYVWFVNRPEIPLCMFTTDLTGELIELDSVDAVENTPGSYYADGVTGIYIHYPDGSDPTGKVQYPISIPRPTEGTEYRVYILFNSTGTINVPTIRMYGWYPEKEYTQLSADANAGQNQIVLKEDLGLQQGDIIVIGSGTEYGPTAETAKGIYTVSSYDSGTKIVTLSANLQTNRLEDDYVAWASRPIKIARTSGTTALLPSSVEYKDNIHFGVNIGIRFSPNYYLYPILWYNNIFKHCSCSATNYFIFYWGKSNVYEDCISYNGGSLNPYLLNGIYRRCISMNTPYSYGCSDNTLDEDSITQNTNYVCFASISKNITAKNAIGIYGSESFFKDCVLDLKGSFSETQNYLKGLEGELKFKDCIFTNSESIEINQKSKFYNCLFEFSPEFKNVDRLHGDFSKLESFDHNQIPGNYKAWMKGGKITTVDYIGD